MPVIIFQIEIAYLVHFNENQFSKKKLFISIFRKCEKHEKSNFLAPLKIGIGTRKFEKLPQDLLLCKSSDIETVLIGNFQIKFSKFCKLLNKCESREKDEQKVDC